MSQMKAFRFGPLALGNSAVNILNPGTTTGGTNSTGTPYGNLRIILTQIRVVNKTGSAATFSLFIGATAGSAAGTEWWASSLSVAANNFVQWNGRMPLDVADFLTGLASAATTLTIEGEGEIGVA